MQRLVTLYTATFGKKPHDIKPLAGAGSSRSYYRLLGNDSTSVIGTVGDDVRENEAYIAFHAIFHKGVYLYQNFLPFRLTRQPIFSRI